LGDKQVQRLTQNGTVKKVTKTMVKHFLKQEGAADEAGKAVLVGVGEPDPNSFD
jgi:hypothetical protein